MSEDPAACIPMSFALPAAGRAPLRIGAPDDEDRTCLLRAWLHTIERSATRLFIKWNAGTSITERIGERFRATGGAAVMSPPSQGQPPGASVAGRPSSAAPDDFAALFARHRDDLTRLCRRMLHDSASVDDALSEIFLRAHRAWPRYDAARPFKPWLRTVAANHCIDLLRRLKTERGLFRAEEDGVDAAADATPSALAAITLREERRDVLAALDALPDRYRLPLVLRFYRDLDYEAIAEMLGVSRGQVGTLLFRAKRHLREELARQHPSPDPDRRRGPRR